MWRTPPIRPAPRDCPSSRRVLSASAAIAISAGWGVRAGRRKKKKPGLTGRVPMWSDGLKNLRDAAEEAAPRAELRRADTDAGAVADLIFLVEQIDHIEAQLDAPQRGQVQRLI